MDHLSSEKLIALKDRRGQKMMRKPGELNRAG